jgi:adenine-specific DNA-methyltransferase
MPGVPSRGILSLARRLRRDETDAEALLWRYLRARRLANAKFRRQHPMGPYILDFFCLEAGLVVEVDGSQHQQTRGLAADSRRTRYLIQQGLRVLRFTNIEVLTETEAVLQVIAEKLSESDEPSP